MKRNKAFCFPFALFGSVSVFACKSGRRRKEEEEEEEDDDEERKKKKEKRGGEKEPSSGPREQHNKNTRFCLLLADALNHFYFSPLSVLSLVSFVELALSCKEHPLSSRNAGRISGAAKGDHGALGLAAVAIRSRRRRCKSSRIAPSFFPSQPAALPRPQLPPRPLHERAHLPRSPATA